MQAAPMPFQEGQRVRGRNGEIAVIRNGVPVVEGAPQPVTIGTPDPRQPVDLDRARVGLDRDQAGLRTDQYNANDAPVEDRFSRENTLRAQFSGLPEVRRYTEVVPLYISARNAADTRAGDLNLIYAFGKAMDPGSVVREAEMVMVQGTSTTAERLRALISSELEGTGRLSADTRRNLMAELRSRRLELARSYANAREQYSSAAEEYGLSPDRVVGAHPAQVYADQEAAARQAAQQGGGMDGPPIRVGEGVNPGDVDEQGRPLFDPETGQMIVYVEGGMRGSDGPTPIGRDSNVPMATPGSYDDSALSQILSGVNQGVASTLGAPVDLMTSAVNLGPAGIDAIANTDLGRIERPFLGSEQIADLLGGTGSIRAESADPTNQFLRRTGQSVGAAAVPLAGTAGTAGRTVAGLLAAGGGGAGAAAAQQAFPGNPWAEIGGEIIGSGGTGVGLFGLAGRNARRAAEAAVPSTADLRQQAGELYRAAESRGVVAGPNVTADLAGRLRTIAREAEVADEATGAVSPMYPHVSEALRVADSYAGRNMNPTQIQVIREGLAEGVQSTEGRQRNLARRMLEAFDEVTVPVAPELAEGRRTASRYLQAGALETRRELASNNSSQYSGSGFENALRTQYRQLNNRVTKGQEQFHPDVVAAIQDVSRGTPASNAARNMGRLAPRGAVSLIGGGGVPFMVGNAIGGPVLGAAMGGGAMAAGEAGRALATKFGIRNADVAELLARNGGAITPEPTLDPELMRMIAALTASQSAGVGR